MAFTILAALSIALQPTVPPVAAGENAARIERVVWLMGSRVRVVIESGTTRAGAVDASEDVIDRLESWERRISTWDPASDFGRFNESPVGATSEVGPEAAALLAEALHWSDRTGGAFDPVVGTLVDAWDLRGEGRVPTDREIAALVTITPDDRLRVDPATGRLERLTSHRLDAGGFGKGGALRFVRRDLESRPDVVRALVDLGGQLWVTTPPSAPWTIEVAHPSDRTRSVGAIRLSRGSVATSGTSERSVVLDGRRFGHILDPRTGRPAPAWGSVTVVTDDPLEADILSTALYVMGPEEGMRWLTEHRPELAALFLMESEEGLRARWTGPMEPHLHRLSPDIDTPTTKLGDQPS